MTRFELKSELLIECKKYTFLTESINKLHFRIDLKALVKNGKIITRLGDGKHIESEKSVMKLNGK